MQDVKVNYKLCLNRHNSFKIFDFNCISDFFLLPLTHSGQGIEPCEVWDLQLVWVCWRDSASGRTTNDCLFQNFIFEDI